MPIAPKSMKVLPPELSTAAEDADKLLEDSLSASIPAPRIPYAPKAITALVKSLATISSLFGMPVEVKAYTSPTPALPPEIVRLLTMVDAAATDYGKPFPVGLDKLRDDAALILLASYLTELSKDKDFAAFLEAESEAPQTEEVEVEEEDTMPQEVMPDMDELFMSRMKRR